MKLIKIVFSLIAVFFYVFLYFSNIFKCCKSVKHDEHVFLICLCGAFFMIFLSVLRSQGQYVT